MYALALMEKTDFEMALTEFKLSIQINPDNLYNYKFASDCYLALHDHKLAIAMLQKILNLKKQYSTVILQHHKFYGITINTDETIANDYDPTTITTKIINEQIQFLIENPQVSSMKSFNFDIEDYFNKMGLPLQTENPKTIQLESDNFIIQFKSDHNFQMINKKTKKEISGKFISIIDNTDNDKNHPIHMRMMEIDIRGKTSQEILTDKNFNRNAQWELVPMVITDTTILYKYLKPIELKDQRVLFNYSVVE